MKKAKGSVFEPIELSWDGQEFSVPAHKVMGAIHKVEAFITIDKLAQYAEEASAPLGKLASSYAAVLRYAGAVVSDEEVYEGMFTDATSQELIQNALLGILMMMLPISARKKYEQAAAEGQEVDDEQIKKESPSGSSKKRSRRRRRKNGSQPANSGNSTPTNSGG